MKIKISYLILFFFCRSSILNCQVVSNNGASVNITSGTVMVNSGSVGNNSGTINNDGTINMAGSLTNNAAISGNGNYNIGGNWINNASFTSGTGTVNLNGTSTQTLSGTALTSFYDLLLNNSAGATISNGTFAITDMLTPFAGTLTNSGGTVTFISNSSKIAVIGAGSGSFGGNFIMQRYVPPRSANWHDFSSPVISTTLADWNQSSSHEIYMSGIGGPDGNSCCPIFYSVHRHSEPSGSYLNITTNTAPLVPGKGYQIYLGDDLSVWNATSMPDTRGTPNSGTVTAPLNYTVSSPSPGANLVGNPFHSHIMWNACTLNNVDPTIYMLDNSGNYVSYTGAIDIPPLQGFFAHALGAGASIGFTQTAKTNSTGNNFYRLGDPYNIQLKLSSTVTEYWHQIYINFNDETSKAYDPGYDAYYILSPEEKAPSLSMIVGEVNVPLIKNTFNPQAAEDIITIPMKARVGISGIYTIDASGIETVTDYNCVLLKDLFKNKLVDLRMQHSYSFEIHKNDNPDRFVLYLVRKNSDCEQLSGKTDIDFFNESQILIVNSDEGPYVHFDLDALTPVTITIYDMLGQEISSKKLEAFMQNEKLDLSYSTGIYTVRVSVNNHVVTGKVFSVSKP